MIVRLQKILSLLEAEDPDVCQSYCEFGGQTYVLAEPLHGDYKQCASFYND